MSVWPNFDFEGIERSNAQWREFARQNLVPGIDPADLAVGMKVTISPNLHIHDRSYTCELLTVVAFNAHSVQVRRERPTFGSDLLILQIHEHHFYCADAFEDSASSPTP